MSSSSRPRLEATLERSAGATRVNRVQEHVGIPISEREHTTCKYDCVGWRQSRRRVILRQTLVATWRCSRCELLAWTDRTSCRGRTAGWTRRNDRDAEAATAWTQRHVQIPWTTWPLVSVHAPFCVAVTFVLVLLNDRDVRRNDRFCAGLQPETTLMIVMYEKFRWFSFRSFYRDKLEVGVFVCVDVIEENPSNAATFACSRESTWNVAVKTRSRDLNHSVRPRCLSKKYSSHHFLKLS